MDAFAATIDQRHNAPAANHLTQPAREVPTRQVAVTGTKGPTGHQPQRNRSLSCLDTSYRRHALGVVEKTEVIFTAFANDDLAALFRHLREEAVEFSVELLLKITGIGGEPDSFPILLGP